MKKTLRSLLALGLLLAVTSPLTARAQTGTPGSADPTFSQVLNTEGAVDQVVTQPDGKILALGGFPPNINVPSLLRLSADGTLDTTFNSPRSSGGFNIPGQVTAFALQPDGKIVFVGTALSGVTQASIGRLNADGSLDQSFKSLVFSTPNNGGTIRAVTVQADGKILVGGAFKDLNAATRPGLARLNADGTVDPTFNPPTSGLVFASALALAVQPDGKVLVAGLASLGANQIQGVARLNADGSQDTTFTPQTVNSLTANGGKPALAVQTDGKIVFVGPFTTVGTSAKSFLARLLPGGSLDGSFTPFSDAPAQTVALQGDGKILIGGAFVNVSGVPLRGVARLQADGSVDTTFNPGTGPGGTPSPNVRSLALAPDGKVIVGGVFAGFGASTRDNLARLLNDFTGTGGGGGGGGNGGLTATTLKVNGSDQPTNVAPGTSLSFIAEQNAAGNPPGLFVRIQTSTTPTVESSWKDLPGGGVLTFVGSGTFVNSFSDYPPAPNTFFRAVAAATGLKDSISNAVGPFFGGIIPPAAKSDLALSLSAKTGGLGNNNGAVANVGDKIVYTLTVNNFGTGDATNVVVRDNLPAGIVFKSADSPNVTTQGNSVIWNVGTLPPNKPGEGRVLRLTAKVSTDAVVNTSITNRSYTVQADGVQPIPGRDQDVTTSIRSLVNVSATSDAATVSPGGVINYAVRVTTGDTGRAANNVQVAVNVPANVNLLGATYFVNGVQTGATTSGETLIFNIGSLVAGDAGRDLKISVQVPVDVAPDATIALSSLRVNATRADTNLSTVAVLPDLSATLSGQTPGNPPQLRLIKFVPDAVQTAQVLALVPALQPALAAAFPGATAGAGLDDLQRAVNPFVVVGNDASGSFEQEVIAPGRPGGPDQTFLTYALIYYNDADGAAGGGNAPDSMLVDRVPDGTVYVPGSARQGLSTVLPALSDNGRTLTFALGKLKPIDKGGKVPRPGLITYKVRVLGTGEGGASLGRSIDAAPAFISTPVLTNRVPSFPGGNSTVLVAPGHGILESIQRPAEFKAGSFKEYDISYKNNGGLPALDFQFTDSFPAGSTFVSVTPISGRGGNVTDLDAANHAFTYHLGNVQPGESGKVRLRVQLTDAAVKQPGLIGAHSAALLPEESFGASARRRPGKNGPVTRDVPLPLLDFLGNPNVSRSAVPGAPKLGIGLSAPLSVKAGDTFDYLVFLTNASNSPAFGTAIIVNLPDNTEFVSASQDNAFVGPDPLGRAVIFPNQDSKGTQFDLVGHSARLCRVTLRAAAGSAGKTLRTPGAHTLSTQAIVVGATSFVNVAAVYSDANSTYAYRADQAFDGTLKAQIIASALETQGFNTSALSADADFKAKVAALRPDAIHTSSGGLDVVHLNSGGLLAPLGAASGQTPSFLAIGPASAFSLNAGGLVASGGGNLVASGGGNLVASGGGNFIGLTNLVASGGGNLVASGGGNLVASGGGNLTALQAFGNLISQDGGGIFVRQANGSLVASGGGNLVASGGGNLVASGGGNLVASGGGNLISQDGGGLLPLNLANLLSQGGGGLRGGVTPLISQDGGDLISQDGGGLLSQDGGGILAKRGGKALAVGGGALISQDGGGVISNDGGSAVMLGANGIVASGGGNLAPRLVASGGGN